ncbi:MAG TPA: MOSC domain-containing protein [Bryobacteraceae bacterium]|nr:MOSC domain-containing protein [Bryobacteraceae bacterium]
MTGSIEQVNISPGGIPKNPILHGFVTPLGIEGDLHAHPQSHGGPLKAILIVCAEAIDELIAKGFPLFAGALGENLTVRGLDRHQMRLGQRYRAGDCLLELTRIRVPCTTLDVYGPSLKAEIFDKDMDAQSPKWGLSGFYSSVVQTGWVRQNDIITLVDQVV